MRKPWGREKVWAGLLLVDTGARARDRGSAMVATPLTQTPLPLPLFSSQLSFKNASFSFLE